MCRLFGVASGWLLFGEVCDPAVTPARCPGCQAIVTELDKFCPNCGRNLKGPAEPTYTLLLQNGESIARADAMRNKLSKMALFPADTPIMQGAQAVDHIPCILFPGTHLVAGSNHPGNDTGDRSLFLRLFSILPGQQRQSPRRTGGKTAAPLRTEKAPGTAFLWYDPAGSRIGNHHREFPMKRNAILRLQLDIFLGAGTALFYLFNCLYGKPVVGGLFLSCYANDLAAGLALTAWLDLLLALSRRHPVTSWKQTVPYLLLCGFVWEVLAPLWKPGAVCDPWDFLAYQAGGFLYLLLLFRITAYGYSL